MLFLVTNFTYLQRIVVFCAVLLSFSLPYPTLPSPFPPLPTPPLHLPSLPLFSFPPTSFPLLPLSISLSHLSSTSPTVLLVRFVLPVGGTTVLEGSTTNLCAFKVGMTDQVIQVTIELSADPESETPSFGVAHHVMVT